MPVIYTKRNDTWQKILKVWMKRSDTWTPIRTVWVKRSGTWSKVFGAGPSLNSAPVITAAGNGYLFDSFTTTNGSWDNATSYTRKWLRSDTENGIYSEISGATSTTYITTASDNGKWIRSEVTASDGTNSNQATSAAKLIKRYAPVNLAIPTISGTAKTGNTLTAAGTSSTYWKATTDKTGDTSPETFTYKWYYANGSVATNNDDTASYVIDSDDDGQTLRVKITATNSGGSTTSGFSTATATITTPKPPNTPATPTTSGITSTNITFNWTAPTVDATHNAATSIDYYKSTSSTAPTNLTEPTGNNPIATLSESFSFVKTNSPDTYYFWVRAVNDDGQSSWSSYVSGSILATLSPNPPTNLSLTTDNSKITVSWTAGAVDALHPAADDYYVYYNNDGTTPTVDQNGGFWAGNVTTTEISPLDANTNYYVWVQSSETAETTYSAFVYAGVINSGEPFVVPDADAPTGVSVAYSLEFERFGTNNVRVKWGWDDPITYGSIDTDYGDFTGIIGYEVGVRGSRSGTYVPSTGGGETGGGTTYLSLTYGNSNYKPWTNTDDTNSVNGNNWRYVIVTPRDFANTSSAGDARYGRARAILRGTDGNIYYGNWSKFI